MKLNGEQLKRATALIERGLNREVAGIAAFWMEPDAIDRTISWYDAPEQRSRGVGPGVLFEELRKGGRSTTSRAANSLVREKQYAESIDNWLREHFPDLVDERGRSHPKAWIAVWRLHGRLGTKVLDPAEHGPEIRATVARFDAEVTA